jgi:hypothetical protein
MADALDHPTTGGLVSDHDRFRTAASARSAIARAYGEIRAASAECGVDRDIRRTLLYSFDTPEPSRASYESGKVARRETVRMTRAEMHDAVPDAGLGDRSPEGSRASCVDVADTSPWPYESALVVTAGDCTLFFCTVQQGTDGQARWVFTDTAGHNHTGPSALRPLLEVELRDFVGKWWAARTAE